MRLPNTPAATTTTVSPGSTTFTSAASMPAEPVPEIAIVNGFCVRKTARSCPCTSFMISRNFGSRWPSSGVDIARSTRGVNGARAGAEQEAGGRGELRDVHVRTS